MQGLTLDELKNQGATFLGGQKIPEAGAPAVQSKSMDSVPPTDWSSQLRPSQDTSEQSFLGKMINAPASLIYGAENAVGRGVAGGLNLVGATNAGAKLNAGLDRTFNNDQGGLNTPFLGTVHAAGGNGTLGQRIADIAGAGLSTAALAFAPELAEGEAALPSIQGAYKASGLTGGAIQAGKNVLQGAAQALPQVAGFNFGDYLQSQSTQDPKSISGTIQNSLIQAGELGLVGPILNRVIGKVGAGIADGYSAFKSADSKLGGAIAAGKSVAKNAADLVNPMKYFTPRVGGLPVQPATTTLDNASLANLANPNDTQLHLSQARQVLNDIVKNPASDPKALQTASIDFNNLFAKSINEDVYSIINGKENRTFFEGQVQNDPTNTAGHYLPQYKDGIETDTTNRVYRTRKAQTALRADSGKVDGALDQHISSTEATPGTAPTIDEMRNAHLEMLNGNGPKSALSGDAAKASSQANAAWDSIVNDGRYKTDQPLSGADVRSIQKDFYAKSYKGDVTDYLSNEINAGVGSIAHDYLGKMYPEAQEYLDKAAGLQKANSVLKMLDNSPTKVGYVSKLLERAGIYHIMGAAGGSMGIPAAIIAGPQLDKAVQLMSDPVTSWKVKDALDGLISTDKPANLVENLMSNHNSGVYRNMAAERVRDIKMTQAAADKVVADIRASITRAEKEGGPVMAMKIKQGFEQLQQGLPYSETKLAEVHFMDESTMAAATSKVNSQADGLATDLGKNPMQFKALGNNPESIRTKLVGSGVPEDIAGKRAGEIADLNQGKADKSLTPTEYKTGLDAVMQGISQDIKKASGKLKK